MATKPTAVSPLDDPNLEVIPAPEAQKIAAATPKPVAARGIAPSREDLTRRATELGVDPKLALSFFSQESSGNWNSKNSPKGARGGMQVMPGTFKAMMGTSEGQDDPWSNMEAGLRYISYGQRTLKTKDPELLAAGYHAGYDHPDLKAGKIPGTNDGLISTADYAKNVAARTNGTRFVDTGTRTKAGADPIADLNKAEPGRYEVVDPAQAQLDAEEPGRFEVMGQEEAIKFDTGLKEAAAKQKEVDNAPFFGRMKDKAVEGYDSMTQSLAMARWAVAGGDAQALSEQLAKQFADQSAKPKTTGEQAIDSAFQDVTDAKGAWDTTKKGAKALWTAVSNPKDLAGEVVGQAANALPTMGAGAAGAGTGAGVGAIAGAPAGGVGAAPGAVLGAIIGGRTGMAAGTTATELGAEVTDMIQKRLQKGNQEPSAQNILAILNDKQFQKDALIQGTKKGLTVAAVDQVFMGLGGKVAVAPARRVATHELASAGVDVASRAARKAALASPAGRAAIEAAKPSVAARVGAGVAATGVDTVGEVLGEGLSQQVARGEVDYGDALREGVASLGQSVVEPVIGGAMEKGKEAFAAARAPAPVQEAPNAPSTAAGPLARAAENAAVQPDRVTATAPDGSKVTGTVTGTSEDGKVQIVDDNGEIVTFQTGPNGVQIEQEAPNTPLSNALEVAADQHPDAPAETETNQATAHAESAQAATETVAETPAPEAPKPPELSDMDEPALRERLKYLADQAKSNGGWDKRLVAERRKVEKEINARAPKVEAAPAPEQAALDLKPPKVEKPKAVAPTKPAELPSNLSGAKPRYSYGKKQFELSFASDLDKAAYIAAQDKPSKRDAEYLAHAMAVGNMTEEEVRAHGRTVRQAIKQLAHDSSPGTLKIAPVYHAPKGASNVTQTNQAVQTEAQRQEAPEVAEAKGKDLGKRAFSDLTDPNELINIYRGEGPGNMADGAWWSFDKADAEQFAKSSGGRVITKTMTAADIANQTAQGQASNRHRVFPSKADVGIIQPESKAEAAPVVPQQLSNSKQKDNATKPGKAGPASLGSHKADMDHLFGVDAKRAKAIERVTAGKAWFADGVKAKDFITKNGLKDTHEVKQGKGGRFDVVAKAQPETTNVNDNNPVGKPASTEEVVQKADAVSTPAATVQPEAAKKEVAPAKAAVIDNRDTNKGEYIVRSSDGKTNIARFEIGKNAAPIRIKFFNESVAARNEVQEAINQFMAQRKKDIDARWSASDVPNSQTANAEPTAPVAEAEPAETPLVKAMNDLMEVRQRIADQGQVVDDRLFSRERQLKALVKELESDGQNDELDAEMRSYEAKADQKPAEQAKPDPFAGNKIFTADKVAAARALLKSKMGQLNSGLDPEMAVAGMTIAGGYIEQGVRSFSAYAKAMIEDFGDGIKPYLLSFYESVRHYPGIENDGMSTPASAQAQFEALMLANAEADKAKEAPAKPETKEQVNDTQGNDADYAEPLDNELPQGNPELAQDVAPETSAGVREPNPAGNGRTDRNGSKRRTGVGRGEKPVLHGPAAEVRPLDNGPLNRKSDTPNQLPLGGFGNFQITDEDKIGEGTKGQKLRNNMAAIRTLRQIQKEGRAATPEEQATMAKFVGWGGLRELIDPNTTGKQWLEARAELLGTNGQAPLLVGGDKGEDWIALQRSTTAAHYTAPEIVKAMWQAAEHFGFAGGRALEPTSGIGNFIGLQPAHLSASTEWHGAELDTITGQLAKLIYPEAAIHAGTGFESVPFAKGAFDLAIGNPPFGSLTIKSDVPAYAHIPEMKIHNYIIAKTGEHLRPGGVMAMVVTHRFLDTANPEAREYLAKSFNFLGAFRLPNDAFKANAGTEVVTDVLFLQKLRDGEKSAPQAAWLDTEGKITVDGQEMRVNRYYQANPNHILGRSAMDGSLYAGRGDGEYTVHSDGRDLNKAISDIVLGDWAALKDVAKPTNADQDVAAVMLTQSDLPIGGVVLDEAGKIMKREMDDEAGNAVINEVTPETLWKDGAEQWQGIEQAAKALRDGKDFAASAKEFADASAIAYTAKGEKRPKPTKAEQAVYDIRDSLDSPAYRWSHDAQLAEITNTLSRKKLGAESYQVLKGLLGLRTATLKLITAEMKNAPNMEELRAALNKEYDGFVAKHGYVSDPANANLLDGDVGVESGLEAGFRPKNGKTKASANKSDIFTQRVNFPYKEITSAKDANDGLQISMSERGRLDIGYIAGLTGQSKAQVITELSTGDSPSIFFDPATNEYEDADSYLSGNVKRKLDLARAAGLKPNVKALEAVQPTPKTRDNVKPNIRGSWMPEAVFEQFLTDIGVQSARVNIIASQGMILAQQGSFRETEFGAQFKSGIKSVTDIFNSAASGKPITIWVESSDGKRVKNEAATKEVNLLVERMAKVFEEWAYANDDRVNSIVEAFNEKMNTHVPRKFDGNKYLKTVGANPSIVLRTTQKNAAWRMVQADTVLLDHVVGAGKTFTIITGVKERKRLGLSRKPLIVVPNHLVTQWAKDFYALYPGAKVLAATPDDLAAKKRKRMFSRIATGDYDAVIIGHSSMGFIPAPFEDQQRVINENISELQEVLNEMKSKKESGRTLTQIQERLQKYEGKLKDLMDGRKDDIGLDLESMGIDYIAVDEMHEFKNLEYSSDGERVVGMNDPKGSKKAFDLYIKIRGLLARGGAVTGATGTPVSNSLVELYTMMKYLAHKDLTERAQSNFDAWSGAYTRTENKLEYTATQKLKPRRVLAGLNNLSALKQLYESFADVISMDDLKRIYSDDVKAKNKKLGTTERTEFPVPKVEGGKRVLDAGPITSAQSLYMDYLVARMNAIEQKKSDKTYAAIDNPLYVLTDARKMSLDIRIVDPTAPRDENGKVARAAERIKGLYDKWDAYKGTQMVFCDLSTPAKNAVKEAKALIRDSLEKIVGATEAKRIKGRVEAQGTYINQWRYIESLANDIIDNPQTDPEVADKTAAYLASLEDVDATMTTADVGFSVYDDLRQVLIDKGIPEREVAFIHDYNTPEQKAKLFQAVNDGEIRVLLGSSAKMGAGTNAQQRLVGLHHMDAPWRPSDVEQREGRIIRQGNGFYGAIHDFGVEKLPADIRAAQAALKAMSPNGFEVSITAYSTNGTSDAVMWQVLERKAKAIEEFRSTEMDSTDEDEGDANQYAEFMAQSTGNPVFKLKLEAEREVDLLDAETRGVVLAKSQAKQFMANYDRDLSNAEALIKMSTGAKVDSVTVGKESGTAQDFNAAMAAADAKYTEDYAKYLEKKEEANKALDAWNEQLEMERGEKPKMPTAPAKPGPMSKQVLEASGYARAIKGALEKGTVLGNYEFKIGNVDLRVRKSPVHETFWFVDIHSGKDWQGYESADALAAENSAKLAMALTPEALAQKIQSIGKSGQWTKDNLESQRAAKEKLATRDIGTDKLEKAKKVAEWYKAQVGFAEQQADEIRGRRVNQYIAGDRKRPLEQFKSEAKQPKPVEFEGETYNLTGYVNSNLAQALDKSGNEVLVVKGREDKIEKIITKPAGVDYSGIKKVDDAAFAENDTAFDATGWTKIEGDTKALTVLTDAQSKKDIELLTRKLDGHKGLPAEKDQPFQAVRLPDADDLAEIGDAFGVRTVGFDLKPGAPSAYDFFSGVTFKASSKAVFLGARASRPHLALLGHETAHQLRAQRPDLYNKLVDAVSKYVDEAKYEGEFVKSAVAKNVKTVEGKQEEFMGEVLSDAFMEPTFWRTLYKESPKAFKNVYNIVLRLLQKLAGTVYGKKSAPYLTDYDRVIEIAGEVLAELGNEPPPQKRSLFGISFAEKGSMTADQFYSSYYQTTLRDSGDVAGILENGWKSGIGPNALPAYRGGEPTTVIQQKYMPRAGATVLLVPKSETRDTPNGRKIKDGWKPQPHEIVNVTEDGQAMYEAWLSGQDVAFAEKEAAPEGLTPPDQGLLRRIQASVQNNMNRVRQVQDRIEKRIGRKLPEYADYYGAETNRPGRVAARLEDAEKQLIQPLMEELAKSGHTADQLDELLHAQHAEERNKKVAEINPDYPDGGSGMTTDEANQILAKYRGDRALQSLAAKARQIASDTLDLKLAYGLIDTESHETLTQAYKAYVPLKGAGEYGPKIKKAMGHDAREEHILENLARDYNLAVVAGERNLARKSLLQMVLQNPDKELWTVGVPPKGRYIAGQSFDVYKSGKKVNSFDSAAQAQAWIDGRTDGAATYIIQTDRRKFVVERDGVPVKDFYSYSKAEDYIAGIKDPAGSLKIRDAGETVREFVKPLQDNEVMVYVDGQPVRIQIADEKLARQLRPLDQGKMHVILEFMRSVNRYLSKIYTGYNPAFILRNTARDAMTGTINILGNEGAVTAAKAWANYPAAIKAMGQWAATGKVPAGETGKFLEEYRSHGGKTGASWMADLEEQGKSLQRMYDDAYGASGYLADGKVGKATLIAGRKIVGGMAHVVEIANQATENGLRLALYMAMRKQGKTAGLAAQAAKSVTVDFDRKGSMTGALGAIYLFFNPAVQGTANAIKTLAKGQHKGQAWTALGMLGLLGFYAATQGMDDDKDRWLGENWETRTKNMIFNIGGKHIRVPVSQEFAPFYAYGVAMAEGMRGESKMATAGRMVSSFIDAYFPLQGAYSYDSDNHGADLMQAAIPTVLKPSYQSATNRNSFGSQIVPETELTKERPDNLKMYRGTKNSTYDAAAQGIAEAGVSMGAGRYANDITKVSPETIKHFWRTYTGGLGTFISDTIGVAAMTAADPAQVEAGDVPIVKDFYKANDVKPIRGRFYDLSADAKAAATEFQQAKKAGDGDALDKIMNDPKKADLLGLDKLVKHTAQAAAKLRDQETEINADKTMTPSQKRAALKELEQAEEALYRGAIEAFK